jgi:hypothetical protein
MNLVQTPINSPSNSVLSIDIPETTRPKRSKGLVNEVVEDLAAKLERG